MAVIVPTVLASNAHQYREQIESAGVFADRIHLDFTDGVFAKNKTLELEHAWLPENIHVDLHIMHKNPADDLDVLLRLKPNLVIVHAEADGDFVGFAAKLMSNDIKVGVALLSETPVSKIVPVLLHINHVLIFSGSLGHFGGEVDFGLLSKVDEIRAINPDIEIGWDGGINDQNIQRLVNAGVDVLNVGGFIQRSHDPKVAYDKLASLL